MFPSSIAVIIENEKELLTCGLVCSLLQLFSLQWIAVTQAVIQIRGPSGRQEERQHLTIFYNGNICVCDVTELQARAILVLASREMQQRMTATPAVTDSQRPNSPSRRPPQAELCSPTGTGLSMKRSLQRFLQKRKLRSRATPPYHMDQ